MNIKNGISRQAVKHSSAGFTLVELLVVVAIIALLVSILLPSLGRAKEQTRVAMCMSNLKGLGLAFTVYTSENDDWYPLGADPELNVDNWDFLMQPYYGSYGLLHCPSDKLTRPYEEWAWPEEWRYPRSYGINRDVAWMSQEKATEATDPSDTILLGELREWVPPSWSGVGVYHQYLACGIFHSEEYWLGRQATFDAHSNGDAANYLFCSGRVGSIPANDEKLHSPDYYYWYCIK